VLIKGIISWFKLYFFD